MQLLKALEEQKLTDASSGLLANTTDIVEFPRSEMVLLGSVPTIIGET